MENFRTITCNLKPTYRIDTMEGKQYMVVPMIMMVEGVHNGTCGPLYYPKEEMEKIPEVWNTKPIIVYHPGEGMSACDPDILTNRKIGVVMNTKMDGDKWKSEAWLEKDRMEIVDDRVLTAVENGNMMELSTGLFTETELMSGEWKGETYVGIARNWRPDHLAILPDCKGACSIEDGAGLLRLNAEAGYEELKDVLRGLLTTDVAGNLEYVYIEEVYKDRVIYELNNVLYQREYSTDKKGKTKLVGLPTQVVKRTSYEIMTLQEERNSVMTKEKLVKELIANQSTQWAETDREALTKLDEKVLSKMLPVQNQDDDDDPASETPNAAPVAAAPASDAVAPVAKAPDAVAPVAKAQEAGSEEAEVTDNQEPQTVEEYIQKAPPGMRDVLRAGHLSHLAEKKRLVNTITANERNKFSEKVLMAKDVNELQNLACLASNVKTEESPVHNFFGQGDAFVDNNEEEPLAIPSTTFKN